MGLENLTVREREIVRLILEEKSSSQISKILGISNKTVESHRKNIYLKSGVKSIVGLVKVAMAHKNQL
ncbi:MAG: helix-turn-helix transcriptional regulator [Cyclobacteriaceae bacterium]